MKVSVIIDPAHDQHDTVRYDIQTFLHLHAHGCWPISEKEQFDGSTVRTTDLQDPSEMVGHIRETVAADTAPGR